MTYNIGDTLEHDGKAVLVLGVREEEDGLLYDVRVFSTDGPTGDSTWPACDLDEIRTHAETTPAQPAAGVAAPVVGQSGLEAQLQQLITLMSAGNSQGNQGEGAQKFEQPRRDS